MVIKENTPQAEIMAQMYVDKAFFGRFMFPKVFKDATPQFHHEIYDLMGSEDRLNAMICFRGSAKSTIALFVNPMHLVAFCPREDLEFIPLCSESQLQSINHLTQIKSEIESNGRFRQGFGDLRGERWGQTDIITSNGCRIMAMGMRQKVRGIRHMHVRPTHFMADDLESETNTQTPEMRNANFKWMLNAVIPSLDPDRGKLVNIGTIVHHDCILNRIRTDPHWNVVEYAIVDDLGKPTWKDRFPLERINKYKAEYESQGRLASFYQEYMNIPTPPEDKGFTEEDIQWHSSEYEMLEHNVKVLRHHNGESRVINTFMGIDLAVGTDIDNDQNAWVVMGIDHEFNIYVLETKTKRTSDPDLICKISLDLIEKYDMDAVGIETVQFQQVMATLLMKRRIARGLRFGMSEFKPRNRKDVRLYSLQPDFKMHKVFLRKDQMESFFIELLHFPRARHDDQMDAFYYARQVAYKPVMADPGALIKRKKTYMVDYETGQVPSWQVL